MFSAVPESQVIDEKQPEQSSSLEVEDLDKSNSFFLNFSNSIRVHYS